MDSESARALRLATEKDREVALRGLAAVAGIDTLANDGVVSDPGEILKSCLSRRDGPADDGCAWIADLVSELGGSCERAVSAWVGAREGVDELLWLRQTRTSKACTDLSSSIGVTAGVLALLGYTHETGAAHFGSMCSDLDGTRHGDRMLSDRWNELAFSTLSERCETARRIAAGLPARCRPDGLAMETFCTLFPPEESEDH